MKLALKELGFYKFRYTLVTIIILLLAFLVLFVSALAQGLSKENISGIEKLDSQNYVIQTGVEDSLSKSKLTDNQIEKSQDIKKGSPLTISMQTIKQDDSQSDLLFSNVNSKKQPKANEGHFPEKSNEVLVNEKLKADDYKLGDKIDIKDTDTQYKISGFTNNLMFSHTSMAYVNGDGMDKLKPKQTAVIAVGDLTKQEKNKINDIDGAKVVSEDDLKDAIPSFQAEQQPLNLMIVFLFVISAIVLAAFFYVITIQKTSQFGILKAMGTKTSALVQSILIQIMLITFIGVLISIGAMLLLSAIIPVSMPFYLNINLMVLIAILFLVVAFIGSLLSLVRVTKIDPLDAIGGE